jgi:hypothetical protein
MTRERPAGTFRRAEATVGRISFCVEGTGRMNLACRAPNVARLPRQNLPISAVFPKSPGSSPDPRRLSRTPRRASRTPRRPSRLPRWFSRTARPVSRVAQLASRAPRRFSRVPRLFSRTPRKLSPESRGAGPVPRTLSQEGGRWGLAGKRPGFRAGHKAPRLRRGPSSLSLLPPHSPRPGEGDAQRGLCLSPSSSGGRGGGGEKRAGVMRVFG